MHFIDHVELLQWFSCAGDGKLGTLPLTINPNSGC